MSTCPSCGASVQSDFKVCPNCGAALASVQPVPVAAPPTAAPPPYQPARKANGHSRTPLLAMLVIIILLGAFLGYYYLQSSSEISSLNQTAASQSSQLGVQAQQIASDNAKISSDTSEITNLTSTVSSLQARISTLNGQVSSDQSQITQLESQVSSYQSQISTLQSQVSSLQSQVSSLEAVTGLTESTLETNAQSFNTGTSGGVQITSFTANYAGYVAVTVTAASDPTNEGPEVDVVFASSVHSPSYSGIDMPSSGFFYPFSSSSETISVPVAPGTVTVYLETSDITAQTATVSVVYYY
jgi:chaperonin cofactor prefoldin